MISSKYPRVIGVTVDGSVGRGEPLPYSDIDVLAIVRGGRTPGWFSYFDDDLHVTIGFVSLKEYGEMSKTRRDFFWRRGCAQSARVLYDPEGIISGIVRKRRAAKSTLRIVEGIAWHRYCEIIEYIGKLRNGWLRGDECLTRYAAKIIAENVQEVVIALNNISPVSENVVWHQVMKARKKPHHFSTDYPIALGIKGMARTQVAYRSGLRLARETIELLRTEFRTSARIARFKSLMRQPIDHYLLD